MFANIALRYDFTLPPHMLIYIKTHKRKEEAGDIHMLLLRM